MQMPQTKTMDIRNFGSLGKSRLYNVDNFLYKSTELHYINEIRNRFRLMPLHKSLLDSILSGRTIDVSFNSIAQQTGMSIDQVARLKGEKSRK